MCPIEDVHFDQWCTRAKSDIWCRPLDGSTFTIVAGAVMIGEDLVSQIVLLPWHLVVFVVDRR